MGLSGVNQPSLIEHLTCTMGEASQRLEACIDRSCEQQEMLMNTFKEDQLRFQDEVRSSLYSIRVHDSPHVFGGPSTAGIRATDLMGPSTVAQNDDLIEMKIPYREESVKEMVSKAFETAMEAMRHSLKELLIEGQGRVMKKLGAEVEGLESKMGGTLMEVPINGKIDKSNDNSRLDSTGILTPLVGLDERVKVNTPHQLAMFDKTISYKFHENEYGKFSGISCNNFKNILHTTEVFEDEISCLVINGLLSMNDVRKGLGERSLVRDGLGTGGSGGGHGVGPGVHVSSQGNEMFVDVYARKNGVGDATRRNVNRLIRVVYDDTKGTGPCRSEFKSMSLPHIFAELQNYLVQLNIKAVGAIGVCTHLILVSISKFCRALQIYEVAMREIKLLNLAATFWKCMNSVIADIEAEILDNTWCAFESLIKLNVLVLEEDSEFISDNMWMKLKRFESWRIKVFKSKTEACAGINHIGGLYKYNMSALRDGDLLGLSDTMSLFKSLAGLNILYDSGSKQVVNPQNCRFTGNTPEEMSKLTALASLDITQNNFEGEFPSSFGKITNLVYLIAMNAGLSGTIPRTLGNYEKVSIMDLSFNLLFGPLPDDLAKLESLNSLVLGSNHLSGTLLEWLFKLKHVESIMLAKNNFYGPLPALDMPSLMFLDVSSKKIFEKLPSGICQASSLTSLLLSDNNLNGTINNTFQNCLGLTDSVLSGNKLNDSIPAYFWELQLVTLELSKNQFSGTVPNLFWESKTLMELLLSNNMLVVHISAAISTVSTLQRLQPDNNLFEGSIPSSMGQLRDLTNLSLHGNKLTGDVPLELFDCREFVSMDLSSKWLTGSLPSSFFNIRSLTYLDVSTNFFYGPISLSLKTTGSLVVLNARNNNFSGTLGDTLCNSTINFQPSTLRTR